MGRLFNVALCRDYLSAWEATILNFEGGARVNAAVSVNGDGRPAFEVEVVKRGDPELCPAAGPQLSGTRGRQGVLESFEHVPAGEELFLVDELGPHRLEIVRTRMVMPLLPGSIDHEEEPVRLLEHFHADGTRAACIQPGGANSHGRVIGRSQKILNGARDESAVRSQPDPRTAVKGAGSES